MADGNGNACLLLVFLVLGIINLLFLLKEARKRNEAATWESQDLCPGAASWCQQRFGCNGALVGLFKIFF